MGQVINTTIKHYFGTKTRYGGVVDAMEIPVSIEINETGINIKYYMKPTNNENGMKGVGIQIASDAVRLIVNPQENGGETAAIQMEMNEDWNTVAHIWTEGDDENGNDYSGKEPKTIILEGE